MNSERVPIDQMQPQAVTQALEEVLRSLLSQLQGSERPRVLLSACLAGEAVRYDGADKHLGQALVQLQQYLQLSSYCPEMAAGMGVPRAPIQWVETAAGERQLQRVDTPHIRAEAPLRTAVSDFINTGPQPLSAILKARSPSCGANTAALLSEQGELVEHIDGLFTAALRAAHPQLAIVDESYFESSVAVYWFILGHYLAGRDDLSEPFRRFWPGSLASFLSVEPATRQQALVTLIAMENP